MPAKKRGKSPPNPSLAEQSVNERRLNPLVVGYRTVSLPRLFDRTSAFKKDWERLRASGRYDMSRLKTVMMHLIANDGPLPAEFNDHPLSGKWSNHRDCHIGGDWILIYKLGDSEVIFVRTGTHSELFN